MIVRALPIAAAFLLLPCVAAAKAPIFVTSRAVADKPAVTLDTASGYVLLRTSQAVPLLLMKYPTPEDQATYNALRQTAFEKAQKRYRSELLNYQSNLRTYPSIKKLNPSARPPVEPKEPKEDSFVYTPFETLAAVGFGPDNRFAKEKGGASTYLQAITPGTYRIYGPVSLLPDGGATGTCFCMGSVKFTVHAGEVTDLGTGVDGASGLTLATSGVLIDARIKDWPIKVADYRAVGKLPNYFGITLGRIAPIDGVISYDRDRIVDEVVRRQASAGETAAATP